MTPRKGALKGLSAKAFWTLQKFVFQWRFNKTLYEDVREGAP